MRDAPTEDDLHGDDLMGSDGRDDLGGGQRPAARRSAGKAPAHPRRKAPWRSIEEYREWQRLQRLLDDDLDRREP